MMPKQKRHTPDILKWLQNHGGILSHLSENAASKRTRLVKRRVRYTHSKFNAIPPAPQF